VWVAKHHEAENYGKNISASDEAAGHTAFADNNISRDTYTGPILSLSEMKLQSMFTGAIFSHEQLFQ
jgi:hypothetical protein